MDKLQQLAGFSTIVADTGDISAIRQFKPLDATTNPSLLLKASELPEYRPLLLQAVNEAKASHERCSVARSASDRLATLIGAEILKLIDGRISTEVDARLSFDTHATVERARQLMALYDNLGVDKSRVLIKIAATWEGIQAAAILESEGIQCNLTLIFAFEQARACADAGVFLISPFVGRILDWYKTHEQLVVNTIDEDPGVQSVRSIYQYYKQNAYDTLVMAASFRNTAQIEALAGCDRLTISPGLLAELSEDTGILERRLAVPGEKGHVTPPPILESDFRFLLNENPMATEKLSEGIRLFTRDQILLEEKLNALM